MNTCCIQPKLPHTSFDNNNDNPDDCNACACMHNLFNNAKNKINVTVQHLYQRLLLQYVRKLSVHFSQPHVGWNSKFWRKESMLPPQSWLLLNHWSSPSLISLVLLIPSFLPTSLPICFSYLIRRESLMQLLVFHSLFYNVYEYPTPYYPQNSMRQTVLEWS